MSWLPGAVFLCCALYCFSFCFLLPCPAMHCCVLLWFALLCVVLLRFGVRSVALPCVAALCSDMIWALFCVCVALLSFALYCSDVCVSCSALLSFVMLHVGMFLFHYAVLRVALLCRVLVCCICLPYVLFALFRVLLALLCWVRPVLCFCAYLYIAALQISLPCTDLPCFAFGRFALRDEACSGPSRNWTRTQKQATENYWA